MLRVILVLALVAEIAFLVGLRLWLKSMPDGFIQGFGAGLVVVLLPTAFAETYIPHEYYEKPIKRYLVRGIIVCVAVVVVLFSIALVEGYVSGLKTNGITPGFFAGCYFLGSLIAIAKLTEARDY